MDERGYRQDRLESSGTGNVQTTVRPSPVPHPRRSIRSWPPHPATVTDARRHTRSMMTAWQVERADDVEMIVSELMTNAVKASLADWTITLWLFADDDRILVCVWDESDEPPVLREPSHGDQDGRGLVIVEALSDAHGYIAGPHGGKVVWSKIDRPR